MRDIYTVMEGGMHDACEHETTLEYVRLTRNAWDLVGLQVMQVRAMSLHKQ